MTAADLAKHQALGIPPNLLLAAGVRRVNDAEARDLFGITAPVSCLLNGIVYPYFHVKTGDRVTCRLRRDHPELDVAGRPIKKYLAPLGDSRHLYFAPGALALLDDPQMPVIIVESEKAVLAVTAAAARAGRSLLVVGTGGCYGWRGRIGKEIDASGTRVDVKGALPDLDRIAWVAREAVILFDANSTTNANVQAARRALAAELTGRGASVRLGELPIEPDVNGPDDYVAKHGDSALFALFDRARPALRSQDTPIVDLLCEHELTADAARDVAPDVLDERLRALALSLTGADSLRRALIIDTLKKSSKLPATVVDAALKMQGEKPEHTSPSAFMLADEDPWLEPVNGARLLDETAALVRRYVVLSEAEANAAALWIGAAHAIDAFRLMPMLLISSPSPECGKSTAASVVAAVAPRPIKVANLTPAVLFRLIHQYRPTLIADEADTWLNDEKSELRGVFNAAHTRAGAVIPRCVGDDHHIEAFNVFGAKVLAMIGRPPASMLSRSIMLKLRRKTAAQHAEHLREESAREEHEPLRRRWRRWTQDHRDALQASDPVLPRELPVNRASDNWRPLVAVAELAAGGWLERAHRAAVELSGVAVQQDESESVALLTDVRAVVRENHDPPHMTSADIISGLKALPERSWADWNKGRGVTPAQLAKRLRDFGRGPLGLRTRKVREGSRTVNAYLLTDLQDAWAPYPPDDPEQPEQANESGPKRRAADPEHSPAVPGQKTIVQSTFTEAVPGVPGSQADRAEETQDGLF